MTFFFFMLALGAVTAMIAHSKGRPPFWWFIYGALLALVAIPHALLIGPDGRIGRPLEPDPRPSGDTRKCPACAEVIKSEARKCRFCGEALSPPTGGIVVDDPSGGWKTPGPTI